MYRVPDRYSRLPDGRRQQRVAIACSMLPPPTPFRGLPSLAVVCQRAHGSGSRGKGAMCGVDGQLVISVRRLALHLALLLSQAQRCGPTPSHSHISTLPSDGPWAWAACREACLAFHHLHLLAAAPLPFITPVQWSVEPPATSICLTHHSPRCSAQARAPASPKLPWPSLCPHSSATPHTQRPSVPASLVLRHRLLVRVPPHDSLGLTPPCTLSIPLHPVRRPLLFVDRRASRLDRLTRPPPPPPRTTTQPRLLYPPYLVQSIPSVCLHQPKR